MKARFLMDCYGHFQIEVDGQKSQPVLYEGIASLEVAGKQYIGVSGYFSGVLPTECVLEVTKVESASEDSEACNLFHPEDPCTHLEIKKQEKQQRLST